MRLDSETFRELRLVLIARIRSKYSRWCRRLFWSNGAILDWAEDMVQDGLMAAEVDIEKYDAKRASFTYWCWLKTNTVARDSLLREEKEARLKAQLVLEQDRQDYDPIEIFLSGQEAESLLRDLKPEQQEALALYYCGVKVNQIAQIMGYEPKTIYTLLDRGRKKAKEISDKVRAAEREWGQSSSETDVLSSGGGTRPPPTGSKVILFPIHRQRRTP